jgi:hypothetical protein
MGALGTTLLGSDSPYKIYNESFDLVRQDPEVLLILGEPVKGFDEKSRHRHNPLEPVEGQDELGRKFVRIMYDVTGSRGKAKVIAEVTSVFFI